MEPISHKLEHALLRSKNFMRRVLRFKLKSNDKIKSINKFEFKSRIIILFIFHKLDFIRPTTNNIHHFDFIINKIFFTEFQFITTLIKSIKCFSILFESVLRNNFIF